MILALHTGNKLPQVYSSDEKVKCLFTPLKTLGQFPLLVNMIYCHWQLTAHFDYADVITEGEVI